MNYMETLGAKAKDASRAIAAANTADKDAALTAISEALTKNTSRIIAANQEDMENAQANGMSRAMQDRLKLDEKPYRCHCCRCPQGACAPRPDR